MPALDAQELAAVLAGLRLLQHSLSLANLPAEFDDIATNDGEFDGLDVDDIDELCERLNVG